MNYLRNMTIGGLFVLTQVSCSMYLPSLPTLSHVFHVTSAAMMLTLSILFAGYALGQLAWGTASDYIGRKKSISISLCLYLLIAFGISITHHYAMFSILIFALGFVSAAYTSVGNALLKDLFGSRLGYAMACIGITMAAAPALSPIMGAHLLKWFGWQSIYVALIVFAAVSLILVMLSVKDVPSPKQQSKGTLYQALKMIMIHPRFLAHVVPLGLMFGILFSYLGAAPFIFVNYLGYSITQMGYILFATTMSYVFGALYNSYSLKYKESEFVLKQGLIISLFGAVAVFIFAMLHVHNLAALIISFGIIMLGIGMVLPSAKTGAMQVFSGHGGKTASLMKFIQTLGGIMVTAIASRVHSATSITDITLLFLVFTGLSLLSFMALMRVGHKLSHQPS